MQDLIGKSEVRYYPPGAGQEELEKVEQLQRETEAGISELQDRAEAGDEEALAEMEKLVESASQQIKGLRPTLRRPGKRPSRPSLSGPPRRVQPWSVWVGYNPFTSGKKKRPWKPGTRRTPTPTKSRPTNNLVPSFCQAMWASNTTCASCPRRWRLA